MNSHNGIKYFAIKYIYYWKTNFQLNGLPTDVCTGGITWRKVASDNNEFPDKGTSFIYDRDKDSDVLPYKLKFSAECVEKGTTIKYYAHSNNSIIVSDFYFFELDKSFQSYQLNCYLQQPENPFL